MAKKNVLIPERDLICIVKLARKGYTSAVMCSPGSIEQDIFAYIWRWAQNLIDRAKPNQKEETKRLIKEMEILKKRISKLYR